MEIDYLLNEHDEDDNDCSGSTFERDDKWENARFLLKIAQEHSLSYEGVDHMCDSIQSLVDTVCEKIRKRVNGIMVTGSVISEDLKKQVIDSCEPGQYC